MTDTIEQKALALVREVAGYEIDSVFHDAAFADVVEAVHRALEQHEAFRQEASDAMKLLSEEHKAFRQEVSDAVLALLDMPRSDPDEEDLVAKRLARFIIAKPDPLIEVLNDLLWAYDDNGNAMADQLRAAMKARGYEWRKIGGEDHD